MKKILSIALLALFVFAIPMAFVGCGKKNEASLEGTWTFESMKFDHYELYDGKKTYKNTNGYVLDNLFGVDKHYVFTFNSDGTGTIVYERRDINSDFAWVTQNNIIEIAYSDQKGDDRSMGLIFKNGKLTMPASYKVEDGDVQMVYVNMTFKK